jgi:tetraacyldisaccharide 4'-kinase
LRRAGAILIAGRPDPGTKEQLAALAPGVPVFHGRLAPEGLLDGEGRTAEGLEALRGIRAVAISGIARPEGFGGMLADLGAKVIEYHAYPDHAAYGALHAARLGESLRRTGADLLLTTEKDAVKLAPWLAGMPVRVLRVRLEIEDGGALARLAWAVAGAQRD